MLRDDVALRIKDRAGGVLRLAYDRRETCAEERVLHFLHDAVEARLDDLDFDGVELGMGLRFFHLMPPRW